MSKIIIGIDPDSKAHGISVYYNGKLELLVSLSLMDFITLIKSHIIPKSIENDWHIEAHIEDVCANSSSCFHWKQKDNKFIKAKKSEHVGLCKQSQVEIERVISYFCIPIKHHKISKIWKKDKKQFEKVTGWTGRSNEDTRSAAYFGWIGINTK